ncbi:unnamed protein product [Didymodactylos carnosus]|uniref:Uncharacterized protein n=1 Tax=Didymodactylos carnosus TaxID=1234261 RepID=A0A8S2U692_9BILA|nr:unnamed protein product [Didymodactylos carnosus]CAF4317411.1 unnamed protein product [Didymodactylos carnosus]
MPTYYQCLVAVYANANLNLYIAETGNSRIQFWSHGASVGLTIANGSQLSMPFGIWVDANGIMYITDYPNNYILKWSPFAPNGSIIAGGNGSGNSANQLTGPVGIYLDETNNILYVFNYDNHSVMKWTIGATVGIVIAGSPGKSGSNATLLQNPTDITLDQ